MDQVLTQRLNFLTHASKLQTKAFATVTDSVAAAAATAAAVDGGPAVLLLLLLVGWILAEWGGGGKGPEIAQTD